MPELIFGLDVSLFILSETKLIRLRNRTGAAKPGNLKCQQQQPLSTPSSAVSATSERRSRSSCQTARRGTWVRARRSFVSVFVAAGEASRVEEGSLILSVSYQVRPNQSLGIFPTLNVVTRRRHGLSAPGQL